MAGRGLDDRPAGDRRVRRTRAALEHALLELVEERDLPQISVADVAERAGVSRPTFYDHFHDVHELAEVACTTIIEATFAAMPTPTSVSDPDQHLNDVLRTFFAAFEQHAKLYASILGPQGSARIIDYIRRRAAMGVYLATHPRAAEPADGLTTPHDVPAAFGSGALVAVVIDWLQRGCPSTPAKLARQTSPLLTAIYGDRA